MLLIKQDYLVRNKYSYSLLGVTFEKKKHGKRKSQVVFFNNGNIHWARVISIVSIYAGKISTTPDKTVETIPSIF